MRFIPKNLVLDLNKSEVKIVVEYLAINQELNENLIKKFVKYGNKINNKEG
jgi:hypothetical protein